jgi:hypothetical protein
VTAEGPKVRFTNIMWVDDAVVSFKDILISSRCKLDDLLDAALEPADSRSGLDTACRLHGVVHVPGRVASKSCLSLQVRRPPRRRTRAGWFAQWPPYCAPATWCPTRSRASCLQELHG